MVYLKGKKEGTIVIRSFFRLEYLTKERRKKNWDFFPPDFLSFFAFSSHVYTAFSPSPSSLFFSGKWNEKIAAKKGADRTLQVRERERERANSVNKLEKEEEEGEKWVLFSTSTVLVDEERKKKLVSALGPPLKKKIKASTLRLRPKIVRIQTEQPFVCIARSSFAVLPYLLLPSTIDAVTWEKLFQRGGDFSLHQILYYVVKHFQHST